MHLRALSPIPRLKIPIWLGWPRRNRSSKRTALRIVLTHLPRAPRKTVDTLLRCISQLSQSISAAGFPELSPTNLTFALWVQLWMTRKSRSRKKTNIQSHHQSIATKLKTIKICFSADRRSKRQPSIPTRKIRLPLPMGLRGILLPMVKITSSRKQDSSLRVIIFSLICGVQQTSTRQTSSRPLSESALSSQELQSFIATCTTSSQMEESLELLSSPRAISLSILGQREVMLPWTSSCAAMLSHWKVSPFSRRHSCQVLSMW